MFGSRKRLSPRLQEWQDFAARLELADASAHAERLRRFLALRGQAPEPVYALEREGQPRLYFFDHVEERTGPAGSVSHLISVCLIASGKGQEFADLSLQASRRQNPVIESIQAGRLGGQRVELGEDLAFSDAVSVYAFNVDGVAGLLSERVRRLLMRALLEREVEPTFVLSERHAYFSCRPRGDPTPLDTLELLASDLLALYAALLAERGA